MRNATFILKPNNAHFFKCAFLYYKIEFKEEI